MRYCGKTVFRTARDQLFGEDRKALEEISRKGVLPTTQEIREYAR